MTYKCPKWRATTNTTDCLLFPDSQICNEAKNGFRLSNPLEEVIFVRDSSFWNSRNQGLLITEAGIYCEPDNDDENKGFCFSWYEVSVVVYNDTVLYFKNSNGGDVASIHLDYFTKDVSEGYVYDKIGNELSALFTEVAKSVEDPSDVADRELNNLLVEEKYDDAISYAKQCVVNFPDYNSYFNLKLANAYFYGKEDYHNTILACNDGINHADEGSQVETRLLFRRWQAHDKLGNIECARQDSLIVAIQGEEDWTYGDNNEYKYKDFAKESFFFYDDEYIESFLEQPYKDRKTLLVVDTYSNLYQQHLSVLGVNSDFSKFSFPMGHPKVDQLYVGHPLIASKYIPFESYEYELIEDKVREFCQIVQCLGATEISVECINSATNDNSQKGGTKANGSVNYYYTDAKGSVNTNYNHHLIEEISKFLTLHQVYQPKQKPFLPNNLVWYDSEPSWQRLYQQRMHGSLLHHEERIETRKNRVVEGKELTEIKGEFSLLVVGAEGSLNEEQEQKFVTQDNAILSIKVHFAPLSTLAADTNICQSGNLLPNLNSMTSDEKEYFDTLKDCLADDGAISEKERRLLDKIRKLNGISDARAKELEAMLTPQLTDEEREYLEEYKAVVEDGKISEKERRLLDRIRNMNGISDARARELENMI